MMRRLNETRVLRDPVHGYIHIDLQVIWKLLDAPEFQRLRRIHQLGGVMAVYHTAEHSRFSHCLGVYEICRRILNEVPGVTDTLDEFEQTAALCAAPLHDLGHGPLSHSYEAISHIHHEAVTCRLITNPEGEVYKILTGENPKLPAMVAAILEHRSGCALLEDLISSQLDCDRMDYLLRDAYETGTSYGRFDLERILRTLRVKDGRLCIKKSGVHSVEDYIMGRYQMYWQVYLHPDAFGYDLLVQAFFARYARLRQENFEEYGSKALEPVFDQPFDPERFLELDDYVLISEIGAAKSAKDPILADLAHRICDRRLPRWENEASPERIEAIREKTRKASFDPDYYVHLKPIRLEEFLPYQEEQSKPILVLDQERLLPLSDCSVVVRSLLEMKNPQQIRVYFPKEVHTASS